MINITPLRYQSWCCQTSEVLILFKTDVGKRLQHSVKPAKICAYFVIYGLKAYLISITECHVYWLSAICW